MTTDIQIRKAVAADAPRVSALFRTLGPYFTAQPDGAGADAFFASVTAEAITGYIESPRYDYRLAESAEQLAGVAALRDGRHLYHLVVAPPFQGAGLGRRLWTALRDDARSRGNPGVFTVNSSLYGVAVYRKFGFVQHGEQTTANGVVFVPMQLVPEA